MTARQERFGKAAWTGSAGPLTLSVFCAVVVLMIAYLFFRPAYYAVLLAWGVVPEAAPFGDSVAVLVALQCSREGVDVLVENACMNGVHTYSPLWLVLSFLPIGWGSSGAVGLVFATAFALSLLAFPLPRSRNARVLLVFAALSSMTAYALERGNVDLVLFVMITLAGSLLDRRWPARILGYGLLALAALLKFYPAVLLGIAIRERPRLFVAVLSAAFLLGVGFAYRYFPQILEALAHVPRGLVFTDFFGAQNLPRGFAEVIAPLGDRYPVFLPLLPWLPYLLFAMLVVEWGRRSIAFGRRQDLQEAYGAIPADSATYLVLGSLIIVACFFTVQNIYYRGIYFLMILPGLLVLREAAGSRELAQRIAIGSALILFLMWSECLREALLKLYPALGLSPRLSNILVALFWTVRELVWWRVIALLSAILGAALMRSPMGRTLFDARGEI